MISDDLYEAALVSKAWPFEEARKLIQRIERTGQTEVLFETGYGPSGLPHIGTFGEVARTTMVRNAFRALTNDSVHTRLIVFSDDLDGLRKVPDNIPNRALIKENIGKPLTEVPDPFNEYSSFAAYNNARLRKFLNEFGFKYEFASSTEYYKSGVFNETLLLMLQRIDEIQKIMLPTLGADRAATYSPFLPIHPITRIVMQVPLLDINADKGLIYWKDDNGQEFETPVTDGNCKLQWKPDWAMRWYALKVDYEMAGKDLIDSVKLSSQIVRAIGASPPVGFNYELFLDQDGKKISKSKGNGITVDEWLRYADHNSLSLFMYQKPTVAKKLHFDVIPRAVDDYLNFLSTYQNQDWTNRLGNPVWHIHAGDPPEPQNIVSFAMLLNLAAVANSTNPDVLWGFLRCYTQNISPETHPQLDKIVHYAIAYFQDFVLPKKIYHAADDVERHTLESISTKLDNFNEGTSVEDIQAELYNIARAVPRYQDLTAKGSTPERPGVSNEFFNMIYRILLGEEKGPRFGSFITLYGINNTKVLIADALNGKFLNR